MSPAGLGHQLAAVHLDDLADDIAAHRFRRQEQKGADAVLGGADPASFEGATTVDEIAAKMLELPSNHSPMYAPLIVPTLDIGAAALVAAARKWLSEG